MTDATTLVEDYIASWNERDPSRRRELVTRTFADGAEYLDPLMQGAGHDEIDALIAGVQEQYSDHRFELAAAPDAHNDRVRFTWRLVGRADGEALAVGHDFGVRAGDGRLKSVTGFLEAPAS